MTKKTKRPLLDHEKQTSPMPGEVSLEEARIKAMVFSVQEKSLIKEKSKKKQVVR